MLKFLRRYNKAILMVGGSILMVLFLLPSTLQQGGASMMSRTVAHLDGRKLTIVDFQEAVREMEMIQRLNPGILTGLGVGRRPEHWLLLVHEATQAGLVGGPKEARKDVPQNTIDILRAAGSEAQVDRLLANLRGVMRLVSLASPAAVYSTREAVDLGHKMLDVATTDVFIVPASRIGESLPPPDDARLAAHFEKYRDTDPIADPEKNPMGIGYRRPDAVQIEWLSVDRASIEAAYAPDPILVNKYWRQNQAKFTGDFAAVKTQVEAEFKKNEVDQAMLRLGDALKQRIFSSVSAFPVDGNYRTLPEDWPARMPKLSDLATLADAELRKHFPTLGQTASVMPNDGSWRTGSNLARLPGVGSSFLPQGSGGRLMLSQYALMGRELGGPASFGVQENMILGPLQDFRGSYFYFRVLASRKAGPPPSLDEVRDALVRDVRLLDGYEKLKAETDVYRERAIADGLAKVAESFSGAVRTGVEITGQMVRIAPGQASPDSTLDDPALRNAVMAAARTMDPKVEAPTSDAASRTVAVASEKARGLVMAQVVRYRPMTIELFRTSAPSIAEFAMRELDAESIIKAFSYERLCERHAFKIVGADEAEAKKDDPAGE